MAWNAQKYKEIVDEILSNDTIIPASEEELKNHIIKNNLEKDPANIKKKIINYPSIFKSFIILQQKFGNETIRRILEQNFNPFFCSCGSEIAFGKTLCSRCAGIQTKKGWKENNKIINIDELYNLLNNIKNNNSMSQEIIKQGLLSSLITHTSFLPNSAKITERCFCILNHISSIQLCKCGAPLSFSTFKKGYRSTCSKVCNGKISKGRNQTKKKNQGWETLNKKYNDNSTMNIISPAIDFFDSRKITIKCSKCGFEEQWQYLGSTYSKNCPKCTKNGVSFPEIQLTEFLTEHNIRVERGLKKKFGHNEIDLFLPEYNLGIEYNGLFYHSEYNGGKDRRYHINKTIAMENCGFQLLHIFEDEWIYHQEIVKSMILSKIGKLSNRIYARNTIPSILTSKEKSLFLNENHIQGNDQSSIAIGLKDKTGNIVAVGTFGKRKLGQNKNPDWELIRFCNMINTNVIGGMSKVISEFFKINPEINKLISYADRRWSTGKSYLKIGFELVSVTPPNYWYVKGQKRIHRSAFMKSTLHSKLKDFDPQKTEWENMIINNYDRVWDCGSMKFILTK